MPQYEDTKGWNGYVDWSTELLGLNDAPSILKVERLRARGIEAAEDQSADSLWEPLFVRSTDPNISTTAFFDAANAEDGIAFDLFEQKFNEQLRTLGDPVEAVLYRRRDKIGADTDFMNMFRIFATGALITGQGIPSSAPKPLEVVPRSQVVLGIIDDGIAALNARFRSSATTSRFIAIWSQTSVRSTGAPEGSARIGEVVERSILNADLANLDTENESEFYGRRSKELYGHTAGNSLRQSATHGTHMLDLAAGEDPSDDTADDVPILAVQLPPQAYEDTSGTRLQIHILQAIRWLIFHTIVNDLATQLVINMSLGVVAGAKNGKSFLEQQIARELERAPMASGGQVTVDLVVPFGNAHDDQLIAYSELAKNKKDAVILRLQPDDPTPGFVEIRLTDDSDVSDPENLEISVKTPDGTTHDLKVPAGKHASITDKDDMVVARLYHTPAREIWNGVEEPAYLTLAVAPTRRDFDGDRVAQYGAWNLSIKNTANGIAKVSVQVQRDDSPFPRNTGARQAYLETPGIYGWSESRRDFSALGDETPITHAGTNSAFSTIPHDRVYAIGGALVRDDLHVPAEYAAKGATWSGGPPTASAICEKTLSNIGVLAAGTLSSTSARLNGTSAAAATFSRHLCQLVLNGSGLSSLPVADNQDRLGAYLIDDNPAIRG